MLILALRTDKPAAELYLFESDKLIAEQTWEAHRALAKTLHKQIVDTLQSNSKQLKDIEGIIFYKGPGSFTGLRIGASVANALSDALHIPVVGAGGDDWNETARKLLKNANTKDKVVPEYGGSAHVTQQKR